MEQQEIFDGNKLIMNFVGISYTDNSFKYPYQYVPGDFLDFIGENDNLPVFYEIDEIQFHSSWDWLIPVVIKIESLGYDVFINGLYCRITNCGMSDFEIESGEVNTKIEAVWLTVVEFIKWYNENKS